MNPEIKNFAEIERFIKERPKEASALAAKWQEFAKQNPDTLPTDTDTLLGKEIEEAYFYLRDQHEDEQIQTQGGVDPSIVPAGLVALSILAIAFRDRPKIIEDDKDYQKLAEQHKKLWLEKNQGKDFASKEGLDYLYGSLDDESAPSLKKDAEQAFRNNPKYKKRLERYDKESKKVYKNIDDDPRVIRTREEIQTHIKARQEYLKTHEEDKKPEDVSRIIQKQSWEKFVGNHPEKAKKYGQSNIDIKKAYEKKEIKKQLAEIEQKTGRQVRYVEKIHRPQGIDVEEATRRLESIIPSQPPPTLPEPRTTIPQTVGRRFAPPGRRAVSGIGRLGTRLVTQAGLAAGRGVVAGAVAIGSTGWIVIGVIIVIGVAVFLIIMLAGGGGIGGGGGFQATVECVDPNDPTKRVLVTDGHTCAENAAIFYFNLEGIPITTRCLDRCTDFLNLSCDRNNINLCSSPDSVCGAPFEAFCIEYSPADASKKRLYDCITGGSGYAGFPMYVNCNAPTSTPTPTL